ncbi:MAG: MFS transporter [bacterium]
MVPDYPLATLVTITSVFGLGIVLALLGAVKIRLTERLSIDDAQMGKLFSVFNFSNLIFVLVAGVLCDALGFKAVAILGYLIGAFSIFLFGRSTNYGAAVGACLLLGVGGMFMNSVGNTLIVNPQILFADAARSGNLGNVFFGVGAFIVPLLTAWLFAKTSYSNTLNVIALIVLVPIVFAIFGSFPEAPEGFSLSAAAALVTQKQIILGALALMCYIALEVSMGGWITTYATSLGADEASSSRILASFWIALMVGRLITALFIGAYLINLAVDGAWFVMGLAIVAAIVLYSMVGLKSLGAGKVAVILAGLALAPCFPTIVGVTLSRTEQALCGSGFGIIFAVGLIGAIFVPAWMGAISKGKDIKSSMAVVAGTAAVLVVLSLIMGLILGAPLPQ